ncbi:hypothetical protein J7L67_10010, partial [bacterium]|nr:hypothetical protein [bacterium]
MKRFTKLYTWLVITIFYFNTTMPSAYCGSNDNSGSLHISKSLASISKTYTPSSSNNHKFIIHIKDIHCNYKVQKNISLILKQLITDRTTSLVTLEGAAGIIKTDIFSIIPDKNVKQSVCDQFIKKGILTGAESLSIIEGSGLPFTLWGLEDTNLYIENFKTFRDIKFSYKNIRLTLTKVKKLITLIKT